MRTEKRTRREIAEYVGLEPETVNRGYLNPLVRDGRLALMLPEKPRSKNQRYIQVKSTG